MTAAEIYKTLGVSGEVLAYGEKILETLCPRFAEIDARAEINQAKVLAAMQKNRVNATHFAASTGYGYDDEGRDNLERVYADAFHTEAALVRPQITCGTHALALALSADEVVHSMDLPAEDLRVRAYLNGQTFSAEGEKGWYLITVDGYSIGWGKLAGGVMKNHYPKGLRIQY